MPTNSRTPAGGRPGRTSSPSRRSRRAARRPKAAPYRAEIAALAETTAELPSPFRERAIRVVAAIVGLFERAWQGLRRRDEPGRRP